MLRYWDNHLVADKDVLDNYKILETSVQDNGYKGIAIQHKSDNEILIGNAGTDDLEDFRSNSDMAKGFVPDQYQTAKEFYTDVKTEYANNDSKISLTGHSLGGSLSSLLTVEFAGD